MRGFDAKFRDFPDYIIGITKEIWEDRGVARLREYYAEDVRVRSPMGIQRGNRAVMASTMATIHEFPDRQLYGDDVIWSEDATGLLSSHRLLTAATHTGDGAFGAATGRRFRIYVIADCAAKENTIFDEWLVRDYGGIVRQLGIDPKSYAAGLIAREGGPEACARPFTPEADIACAYTGTGNDNPWGRRYAEVLNGLMNCDFDLIPEAYDRAVQTAYPGGQAGLSHGAVDAFWLGLRSSFPDADFKIHHRIGMDGGNLPPRAAIRWSLDGTHSGHGTFGAPTGARVHVMGLAHAEFGPFGGSDGSVRREWALYDEIAIWKQILMHSGDRA